MLAYLTTTRLTDEPILQEGREVRHVLWSVLLLLRIREVGCVDEVVVLLQNRDGHIDTRY